ncbi:hypothetical protein EBZ57_00775 [bacterium]|nr:hypothetical protein [bacterium]
MNQTVLMSGADYFDDKSAINALMNDQISVDIEAAQREHAAIRSALESAGIKVIKIDPPSGCQDGVYTANWALVKNGKALMSRLPNTRKPEEEYAQKILKQQDLEIIKLPENVKCFSGQGDALPCGDIVFTQSPYRTSIEAHEHLKELGFKQIFALQTKPSRNFLGLPKINKITGWPDSPTYDIDLAIAVLKFPSENSKGLIAYCPDVFKKSSQKILEKFNEVDKIIVSKHETLQAFALNLVSNGETVIMNSGAPEFHKNLESHSLKVIALDLPELKKGGGSIRCTTLTI